MKFIFFGLVALSTAGTAQAEEKKDPGICYIYVAGNGLSCHGALAAGPSAAGYYKFNTWFADSEPMANMNAGRCLERALEYKAWCQIPPPAGAASSNVSYVYAFYQVNGVNRINSLVGADNKTVIGDGVARTLRFKD